MRLKFISNNIPLLQALDDLPLAEVIHTSGGDMTDILLPPPAESLYTLPRKKGGDGGCQQAEGGSEQKHRTVRFEPTTGATNGQPLQPNIPNTARKASDSFKKTHVNSSGVKSESAV